MRITRLRAANLLSFDQLDLDLTDSPFTVLVGPNGSGKTNVFRLIRLLIEGTISWGKSGKLDCLDTFNAWRRKQNDAAYIEIDIKWTEPSEGEFLACFWQLVLATAVAIVSSSYPEERWREAVGGALKRALTGEISGLEWSGVLGVRQTGADDLIFYFLPSIANNEWVCALGPHLSGIVSKIPEMPISSSSSQPLAKVWQESLPADTMPTFGRVSNGEADIDSLSMPVDWPNIWSTFLRSGKPGYHNVVSVLSTDLQITDMVRTIPDWREFFRDLGIAVKAPHINNLTFSHVLAHLLLNHCVISEDLLSPPEINYSRDDWWEKAKSQLTSRHLSAYLLSLKNGPQDCDRERFANIQGGFERLSGGRKLDVTMEKRNADGEIQMRITLIQRDSKNDLRCFPLQESGSGLVEMAYLSAVLNSPDSHVILLDEPGRALHPQSLIQMRKLLQERAENQDGPQMIVITHSPYIVPPDAPQIVRRVSRDPQNGCSKITRLHISPTSSAIKIDLQRQDRWGRSPNWPALLFSSAVLLVDGETELVLTCINPNNYV